MAAKKKRLARIDTAQADQIEDYLADLIENGHSYPGVVTKEIAKTWRVPLEVAKRMVDIAFEVRDAIEEAEMPGAERYKFEDVVNYYELLDGFLDRNLEVVDNNSKRRYKFRVGD